MIELGWLSPEGELWQCDLMDHIATAEEIAEKYNYHSDDKRARIDDLLMDKGWVHITRSMFFGTYNIYWQLHLNDYQKNYLRNNVFTEENKTFIQNTSWYEWEYEEEII